MIGKQDILDRSREWQLGPQVVEKDYVLGWLLAAISEHPEAGEQWIFKGGTCLKKCFLETYRFSEDLDFTLLPEAAYDEASLRQTLTEIASSAQELSGITFPFDVVSVRSRKDKLGRETFEGKIGYRGPLVTPGIPRILYDLTRHEPVLAQPVERGVFHPYPDSLPDGTAVATYAFEELLAEKTRALLERTRPRDLYDVVYILDSHVDSIRFGVVRDLFLEKCRLKGIVETTAARLLAVVTDAAELRSEWANMLAHQLPQLPPLEILLARLPALLEWIESGSLARKRPASASASATEELLAFQGAHFWGVGVPLDPIRFAGANRLCLAFDYHAEKRLVEPYSFRRSRSAGKLLLYAWDRTRNAIRAFNVLEIRNLQISAEPFDPRYQVEFTVVGLEPILPTAPHSGGRWNPSRRSGWASPLAKRRFMYACSSCGKELAHATRNSVLREHKRPDGSRCSGRRGTLVRTT